MRRFWIPAVCHGNAVSTWSLLHLRYLCTPKSKYDEAYRQLENLDMMTATKILFNDPPKKKKFGLDFHLVQLFFACMPSFAVFLVAQYARYDSRRMKEEAELKRQAEQAEKAKEMESEVVEIAAAEVELSKVRERVDALEAAVKEIADETKKLSLSHVKDQKGFNKEQVSHKTGSKSKSDESDKPPAIQTGPVQNQELCGPKPNVETESAQDAPERPGK